MSQEELLRAVWPETFVEEGNLTQNISVLRKALAEGAGGEDYILTVPREGYRFIGPVRELAAVPPSPIAPARGGAAADLDRRFRCYGSRSARRMGRASTHE